MPTANGLAILEQIKAEHFPDGYQDHAQSGKAVSYTHLTLPTMIGV